MREEFGAKDPKSQALRFHTQTAGVQLTAQQPEVNLVRVALQGLGAVLGGTQSLHTNSFDEAIALPTEKAARLALRTQQVIAYETDVTKTVDPFAGSYVMESLTDDLEAAVVELMDDDRGQGRRGRRDRGGLPEERDRAVGVRRRTSRSTAASAIVVGLNRYRLDEEEAYEPLRVDPQIEAAAARAAGDPAPRARLGEVDRALDDLRAAAKGTDNVLPPDARRRCAARATVGEVCHALRDVWGTYVPRDTF